MCCSKRQQALPELQSLHRGIRPSLCMAQYMRREGQLPVLLLLACVCQHDAGVSARSCMFCVHPDLPEERRIVRQLSFLVWHWLQAIWNPGQYCYLSWCLICCRRNTAQPVHIETKGSSLSLQWMQIAFVNRRYTTVRARTRGFECNFRLKRRTSFGEATCLWSV